MFAEGNVPAKLFSLLKARSAFPMVETRNGDQSIAGGKRAGTKKKYPLLL